MPNTPETSQRLISMEDSAFEHLAIRYLVETYPELRGIAVTGLNADGKPVPCPVDGIHFLPGPPPCCIFVASTTMARNKLRRKWLGGGIEPGDVPKSIAEFQHWRQIQPNIVGRLFLATNQFLGGETALYRDAVQLAGSNGLQAEIVEASALLRFLNDTHEGQYVRQELLGIQANRVSLPLLRRLSLQSLNLHWQRFGPIGLDVNALIEREAAQDIRLLLKRMSGLVGIVGVSGAGKSSLAQQIARERTKAGAVVFWIPPERIRSDCPPVTTLTAILQTLQPSLDSTAGEEALRIIAEEAGEMLLLVDDVNRVGNPSLLLRTVERWTTSDFNILGYDSGNVTFLVPLWPNEAVQVDPKSQKLPQTSILWHLAAVGAYTSGERSMLDAQRDTVHVSDFQRITDALGGDPFLCGMVPAGLEFQSNSTRSELIRKIFEGVLYKAAQETEARARAANLLVTTYDVFQAMDELISRILSEDEPEPQWTYVRRHVGDRNADILHHLAGTNLLGWLASDEQAAVWRWKHTRLRDAIVGRWLARRVFHEWASGNESVQTLELLAHPGLAEAWALALVFAPAGVGLIRLVTLLGETNPLALAHTLRLNLFSSEQEPQRTIERTLQQVLEGIDSPRDEFAPSIHTLILAQLTQTDDPLVLTLTDQLEDAWDVRFARLRNGDIDVALRMFDRELRRGEFPPMSNFRDLENCLEMFGQRYKGREGELIEHLSRLIQTLEDPEPAILVMGYLGWAAFAIYICASWEARRETENAQPGGVAWCCYLWALGRCCTAETKPILGELLLGVQQLSNEQSPDGDTADRYSRFGIPMIGVGAERRSLSPAAAAVWAEVASTNPDISRDLFEVARRVEDPILVEAYVRWYVVAKPFLMGEFTRNVDALHSPQPNTKENTLKGSVFRSSEVLNRLWKMVEQDTSIEVRQLAFEIWRRSASSSELPQLCSIVEDDPLFNAAVETRVRLGDETVASALVQKIRQEPARWCGYAPRLCRLPEVWEAFLDTYGAALEGDREIYGATYAPRYLPAELVPEFVQRLRPHLIKTPRTWISLLLSDVLAALALVQEAIRDAEDKNLKHLFSLWHFGERSLTRKMLEALQPVIYRFRERDLDHLIERAIKDGQNEWVSQHLPEIVSAEDHPPYWLNEADMVHSLENLAKLVPQGLYAVHATSDYFSVIDSDRHRAALQDPYVVMQTWLGASPSDEQITLAALAVVERGTAADIK